jgi:hypothetical protein
VTESIDTSIPESVRGRGNEFPLSTRVTGVLTSPRTTFARLKAEPRWIDALALVTLVIAATWVALLATKTGQQAIVDQIVRQLETYGVPVSDAKYASIEHFAPSAGYVLALVTVIATPALAFLLSAAVMLLFGRGPEPRLTFRQVLSVVVHTGVVIAVARLLAAPLAWINESFSAPTNLASLLPMLEETSFAARVLGAIDIFTIWWTLVFAVGVSVLYNRRVRPVAFSLWAVYGAIAVLLATVIVWRGGA